MPQTTPQNTDSTPLALFLTNDLEVLAGIWGAMENFHGMARNPMTLQRDSQFADFRLAPSAPGDSQKEEKTCDFWNGCHFGTVNFDSDTVTVPVRLRDLIVHDLEFCG
jgi:hypothetical protein